MTSPPASDRLSADARALIVRELAVALATAWRRQQQPTKPLDASDKAGPDRDQESAA